MISLITPGALALASEGNWLINELSHATFWVGVAFVIFMGAAAYFGVFKMGLAMLDEKTAAIAKELDDARELKEEAKTLLASYQRKREEAEEEAREIVAQATREAENLAKDSAIALEEQIVRRTAMAEQKIASAEAQALSEVRGVADAVAVAAAAEVIIEQVKGAKADALISQGIDELKDKLH